HTLGPDLAALNLVRVLTSYGSCKLAAAAARAKMLWERLQISAFAQCCRGIASPRAILRSAPDSRGQIVLGGRSPMREPQQQPTSLAGRPSPTRPAPTPTGSIADTPSESYCGSGENPFAAPAC